MPFKKILKSVSKVANKVADKIVPKEIAPLLPIAAAFVPGMLPAGAGALARFGIPQALAALGSAKTTGEINPISQGLAALASFASMPKGFTPAEEAFMAANPDQFPVAGFEAGQVDPKLFEAAGLQAPTPGNVIPKDFDMSSLDLSFGDKLKTMVGESTGGLKDLYQAGGLKGALTAGAIGGGAALSDVAINELQKMQAEQEAAMLADQELREQYGQGVQDLASLYGSLINFPLAGINMAEGGIASMAPGMPKGMQVDGRNGTFIPMGVKEKADDVPAMLSKNEFVMTADAVRGMGGGDIEMGAQRMYDLMNNLEARV
jgi:hypothetical protein